MTKSTSNSFYTARTNQKVTRNTKSTEYALQKIKLGKDDKFNVTTHHAVDFHLISFWNFVQLKEGWE